MNNKNIENYQLIELRQDLYDSLMDNKTKVKIINGKNKGKKGVVTKKGRLRNYSYNSRGHKATYYNYFDLTITTDGEEIRTSCNNIEIL